MINVDDVCGARQGDDVAAASTPSDLRVLDGRHEGEDFLQRRDVLACVSRSAVCAVHQVDAPRGQCRTGPLHALNRAQVIGRDPRRERIAHDDVERILARLIKDCAPVTHADLDLRGLGDGKVFTDLFGQQTINLDGDVARLRVRRRPSARERARRATHVQRAETIPPAPRGGHDGAHVLHVLELQIRRIRRIHRRRLHTVQEQRRARAIPPDTRRAEIRLEGDVA